MPSNLEYETLIKSLAELTTIKRARLIPNKKVDIIQNDFKEGFIEALIQGSEILPYEIKIDLKQEGFYKIVHHKCPDFLSRRQVNHEFCKHIVKIFDVLRALDEEETILLLQKISQEIENSKAKHVSEPNTFSIFINKSIQEKIRFKVMSFDSLFELIHLDAETKRKLHLILQESKRLPASIAGYHGGYKGGLHDHVLLVANYARYLYQSMENNYSIKQVILSAIYHDFGKISNYSFKKKIQNCKVKINRAHLPEINRNIKLKFQLTGKDSHVDECFAVLDTFNLFHDDEISKAIIFHHGTWSKYRPLKMTKLGTLLHTADMIASQLFFI